MKVFWGTRLRGFLKHVSNGVEGIEFVEENGFYETNSTKHKVFSKIVRNPLLNILGIFSIPKIIDKDTDCYASFNRFLKCDKQYYIYLENPTALYHYTLGRIDSRLGRIRFSKALNDKNLKGIACMSNACRETFEMVNGEAPKNFQIRTIYPLVPNNKFVTAKLLKEKSYAKTLELLFCVQGVRFVSKGGLETLLAYKRIKEENVNIHLTIITKISDISSDILEKIKQTHGVSLYDFKFSYDEMEKIYSNTNILIQPTSDDSFALTVLEAMKGGCAIISSNMYAIPEMVEDGVNGYLLDPKYCFFDKNRIPNPKVWNNRKKTIYSKNIDDKLVDKLVDKIIYLNNHRESLYRMSASSYDKSVNDELFGENGIRKKWKNFFLDI